MRRLHAPMQCLPPIKDAPNSRIPFSVRNRPAARHPCVIPCFPRLHNRYPVCPCFLLRLPRARGGRCGSQLGCEWRLQVAATVRRATSTAQHRSHNHRRAAQHARCAHPAGRAPPAGGARAARICGRCASVACCGRHFPHFEACCAGEHAK